MCFSIIVSPTVVNEETFKHMSRMLKGALFRYINNRNGSRFAVKLQVLYKTTNALVHMSRKHR